MKNLSRTMFALVIATVFFTRISVAQPTTQPTGEQVMDRYVEVTGGKAAYDKIKSRIIHAKIAIPAQGMNGTVETYMKNPSLVYTLVEIPGVEKKENGFDGKIGWEKSAMQGTRLLEGDELDRMRQEATSGSGATWRDIYSDVKNEGMVDVDGKQCYKLEMTTKSGKVDTGYYDVQTGLLDRAEMDLETPMAKMHLVTMPTDYRDADGVKMPYSTTVKAQLGGMSIEQILTLEKVQSNADIPSSKFEMPEEVKELLKKDSTAPATQPSKMK